MVVSVIVWCMELIVPPSLIARWSDTPLIL